MRLKGLCDTITDTKSDFDFQICRSDGLFGLSFAESMVTVCAPAVVPTATAVGVAAAGVWVVGQMIPDTGGPGQRASNRCNSRSRTGC